MKKSDNNIKNLYNRFSKEMDQVTLPSPEEVITGEEDRVSSSKNSGREILLTRKSPQQYWFFAAAAAVLAAILCISMLMRSNGLSHNGQSPIIATNITNEDTTPIIESENPHIELDEVKTPIIKDKVEHNPLVAKRGSVIIKNDSLISDTINRHPQESTTPLLATTPSEELPDVQQNAIETPTKNITLADETAPKADSFASDSTEIVQPIKQKTLIDDSQKAMKERRHRRNKNQDTKTILEEKMKESQKNIFITTPQSSTTFHK